MDIHGYLKEESNVSHCQVVKQLGREAVYKVLEGMVCCEEIAGLILEFDERETPEAKFARTLDNAQPVMLNDATDGLAWREHEVKLNQVMGRNQNTHKGSQDIWEYVQNIFIKNVSKGNIIEE